MTLTIARGLLRLLATGGRRREPTDPAGIDDVERVADDQAAARRQVAAVLSMRTTVDRAALLGAVRHRLHLPLGAGSVPDGALHLAHADDSSVVIGSTSRTGSCFRGVLDARDGPSGAIAEYAVESWHRRGGAVCGLQQLLHVRATIAAAVLEVDPAARITDAAVDPG